MGLRVERGLGYLALGPAEETPSFVRLLASEGRPYLWITDRPPLPPASGGRILLVSTLEGLEGAVDPKRLGDLRVATAAFISRNESSLVVLDCLEYLVLHNGADRVLRTLADLHDEVTMHEGSLIVLVDARMANSRLVAWLERELDALPLGEVLGRQPDILSA